METNLIFATYGFVNHIPDLPITTCVLLIFDHLAELFISQRGLLSESLTSGENKYAKHVITKLGEYKGTYDDVLPLDNTGERFQVADGNNKRFVVHRLDRVCSCGMWQLYKYPCPHLLAVCRRLNVDFLQYVNDYYNTERSLRVYAAKFNHVPGFSEWPESSDTQKISLHFNQHELNSDGGTFSWFCILFVKYAHRFNVGFWVLKTRFGLCGSYNAWTK